jgi:hypothetical protein
MVTRDDPTGGTSLQTADPVMPLAGTSTSRGVPTSGQPHGPGQSAAATRYVSAAMYLDSELARSVIAEHEDRHHARVPSEGIDLEQVTRHAMAAQRRHVVRDAFLSVDVVLLLIALFSPGHGTLLLVTLVALWAIVAVDAYLTRYQVLIDDIDQVTPPVATTSAPAGNLTVYKGFSPFVGFGQVLQSWSFAVDCGKPSTLGGDTTPFTVADLHGDVVAGIRALGWDEIRLEDRIFVPGTDIRDNRTFLPDPQGRPLSLVDDDVVARLMCDPRASARHYLRMSYHSWGDELIVSVFVCFVLHEQSLFIELSVSLLPPIKAAYHEIDDLMSPPTLRQLGRLAWRAVAQAPGLAMRSIPGVAGALLGPLARARLERRQQREIREHRAFDYGAASSVRERASDSRYHRYFQRLDKERYHRVVEKRVLDTVADFLDARGIDISDVRERSTTILNNGIYVTGGASFSAGSVAAGPGASAQSRFTAARSALTARRGE